MARPSKRARHSDEEYDTPEGAEYAEGEEYQPVPVRMAHVLLPMPTTAASAGVGSVTSGIAHARHGLLQPGQFVQATGDVGRHYYDMWILEVTEERVLALQTYLCVVHEWDAYMLSEFLFKFAADEEAERAHRSETDAVSAFTASSAALWVTSLHVAIAEKVLVVPTGEHDLDGRTAAASVSAPARRTDKKRFAQWLESSGTGATLLSPEDAEGALPPHSWNAPCSVPLADAAAGVASAPLDANVAYLRDHPQQVAALVDALVEWNRMRTEKSRLAERAAATADLLSSYNAPELLRVGLFELRANYGAEKKRMVQDVRAWATAHPDATTAAAALEWCNDQMAS